MKRIIFIILVVLSGLVAYYVSSTSQILNDNQKISAENVLLDNNLFPARPVWWSDGKILAVGILPDSSTGDAAAQTACDLLIAEQLPVSGLRIEVYDVLKIQNEDEWSLLGFAVCE
ncbi:hypothetical protein Q4583_01410 [Neptunomonas phycophila]|jgi:hypothetical protein|uniref:hypothetical protein n=1 Tax=Neptunomonas phycophila TaxID=1572645 RepID=UPI0026E2B215|nr:hypothetical protein [Neptunomonas phycophila]MDO6782754.1 hypothetical protein [Neptunomonas phycophila]